MDEIDLTKTVDEDSSNGSSWHWYSWQVILLMLNAITGLAVFEWSWYMNYRFRKPIPELDDLMPSFRRVDAHRWSKWKFYPGAVTLMLPRFIFGVVIAFIMCLILKIMLIGQPRDQPIRGCRKVTIRLFFKTFTWMFQLVTNFLFLTWKKLSLEDVNYYEEWLGPREEQEKEHLARQH